MDVGCEWRSVFMELRSEVYFLVFEVVVFYAVIDEEAGSGIMALRLRLRKWFLFLVEAAECGNDTICVCWSCFRVFVFLVGLSLVLCLALVTVHSSKEVAS